MKTKQEQIEEMARHMCCIDEHYNCKNCVVNSPCIYLRGAAMNYNNGYRKASEVIDEFVERLKGSDYANYDKQSQRFELFVSVEKIMRLAEEMRQEVK